MRWAARTPGSRFRRRACGPLAPGPDRAPGDSGSYPQGLRLSTGARRGGARLSDRRERRPNTRSALSPASGGDPRACPVVGPARRSARPVPSARPSGRLCLRDPKGRESRSPRSLHRPRARGARLPHDPRRTRRRTAPAPPPSTAQTAARRRDGGRGGSTGRLSRLRSPAAPRSAGSRTTSRSGSLREHTRPCRGGPAGKGAGSHR